MGAAFEGSPTIQGMRCRLVLLLLWVLGAAVCSDKALIPSVHEREVMTGFLICNV